MSIFDGSSDHRTVDQKLDEQERIRRGERMLLAKKGLASVVPPSILNDVYPSNVEPYLMLQMIEMLSGIRRMLRLIFWVPIIGGIIAGIIYSIK